MDSARLEFIRNIRELRDLSDGEDPDPYLRDLCIAFADANYGREGVDSEHHANTRRVLLRDCGLEGTKG